MKTGDFVVVTTKHRGVFAGHCGSESLIGKAMMLTNAQMAVYWSPATHGVLGLAADGPAEGSRITAAVPELLVTDITSISLCTDGAKAKWQACPWSS